MEKIIIELTTYERQLITRQLKLVAGAPQYENVQKDIDSVLEKLSKTY